MKHLPRIFIFILIFADVLLFVKILLQGKNIQVLNPQGMIALQEKDLMFTAVIIMLLVVVPVFIFAIYVAVKYRSTNSNAAYEPDWDHSLKLQVGLWAFLFFIVCILSVINWIFAHKLDPHVAISYNAVKPLTIQVVAVRWRWMFIYPQQGIASVSYLEIPENTPINIELSASDTPMNSFWVPQLGGQIYAMSGMATQTHLIANNLGEYRGSDAEINGDGFSGMTFIVKSVTSNNFDTWVQDVKQSRNSLSWQAFNRISLPSENTKPFYYSSVEDNLFSEIVMKYMPQSKSVGQVQDSSSMQNMGGM